LRLFREVLFNKKTLAGALERSPVPIDLEQWSAAARWTANKDIFGNLNESQLEQRFNQEIVQNLLGYREEEAGRPGTMRAKQPIGPGTVDLALGRFAGTEATIAAPFELKGPRTDLDRIMPGRAKTPVQQAWDYAIDARGARWVLVCNMRVLRLYAFGHGTLAYEEFNLERLDDPAELQRLVLILHADRLLGGGTADLLRRSADADRDITGQLYKDYKSLRATVTQYLADQHVEIAPEPRIGLVQKLLDRLVFIAYAEDVVLLPPDSLKSAIRFYDPYRPLPKWERLKVLFHSVDTGNPRLDLTGYNGGLFAPDPVLDALALPDHLVEQFLKLAAYDYRSEVSVTILGHLFEQTVGDIEVDLLAARGEAPAAVTRKKREGIVYTPDFVTRFLVDRTLGEAVGKVRAELLAQHTDGVDADGALVWRGPEVHYWQALLACLERLTILDPACGSGHFLVAALDWLAEEGRRARARVRELDPLAFVPTEDAAQKAIITRNLYGVDVNAESVEITRLSLWLKTARKEQVLVSLDSNIRVGNSIIEDADYHARAFVWREAFAPVFADGGFDIVIGNPPYVRMEHLKPIKPYLETRYAVVSDRADLYAYFFELGVRHLKPGGRLGYISSSTFFRTGSGAPLRRWLSANAAIDTVIDFGDAQLFAGVTTYPAILTMTKAPGAGEGDLRFLNLKSVPADLGQAFEEGARAMPRARLGQGSWRFESDALDALRAKMASGRRTLAEVYGPPLYGIKTELNEAFVISRTRRDELVAADPSAAALLKPFLIGENLKRWHVESDDLWLIYTPKGRVDIEAHPGVKAHLWPFKARLEARATKQAWWELQQAQAAYEQVFEQGSIGCPDLSQGPKFSMLRGPVYVANTVYVVQNIDQGLVGLLNSKAVWFYLFALSNPMRGGQWRLRMQTQFVSAVPIPAMEGGDGGSAATLNEMTERALALEKAVHHRLGDIAPAAAHLGAFRKWPSLDFAALRALFQKRLKQDIPVGERDQWDRYLTARRAEHAALAARIADAEAELNARVDALFGLTRDETALIAETLAGQY